MLDSSPKRTLDSPATMPTRGALRGPPALTALAVVALALTTPAFAQAPGAAGTVVYGTEIRGATYLDVASLRVALGDSVSERDGVLTWRGAQGVVTFFAGSADALLQTPGNAGPDDWALSAPALSDLGPLAAGENGPAAAVAGGGAGWVIPLDAVQLLGVAFEWIAGEVVLSGASGSFVVELVPAPAVGDAPAAPTGPTAPGDAAGAGPTTAPGAAGALVNGWEVTAINGVPALRFFSAPDKSLLLLDLDLAPLAFPDATAAVDEAVSQVGNDNALLVLVSALSPQEWSSSLTFEQGGLTLETREPYRLRVYRGDALTVGPGAEVAALVMLPPSFSLYRPLAVTWESIHATVTFRR